MPHCARVCDHDPSLLRITETEIIPLDAAVFCGTLSGNGLDPPREPRSLSNEERVEMTDRSGSIAERSPDPIGATEELLRKQAEEFRAKAKAIEEFLERMQRLNSNGALALLPAHAAVTVEEDEFRGRKIGVSVDSYLRRRRGQRLTLAEVVKDLLAGGQDPGKPRGKKKDPAKLIEQKVKILLQNAPWVAREPAGELDGVDARDITIWLHPSADEPKIRKR